MKYSVDEYYKDLGVYERQKEAGEEVGDNLTLHFLQHKTQKNRKAAIAIVSGLVKEALFYFVTKIRPFLPPPRAEKPFFQ